MTRPQKEKQDEGGDKGGEVATPKRAAREALAFMRANADEARAASFQRYFKEPVAHVPHFSGALSANLSSCLALTCGRDFRR